MRTPRYQSRKLKSVPTIDAVGGRISTRLPSGSARKASEIPSLASFSWPTWRATLWRS